MANKIQVRRGLKAELPVLSLGEPGYCTDTKEFFVGTGNGNVNMGGSHWYTGTEMSGTSTSSEYSYASCPDVKVGDMYLNTSYGYTYQCKTAGKGTAAKWQYKGSIRGAQGSYPTVDSSLSSSSTNPVQNKVINSALSGKAPTSHKSTATTYGLGDASSYGHLKLSDSTSSTSSTSSGIAATPKAVKTAYDKAVEASKLQGATIVVGTTLNGYTTDDVDYLCDGANDEVQIQEAIKALPANGGKIVFLEGTYTISNSIDCNKNVKFEGMGAGTILNFNAGSYISQNDIAISFQSMNINFISGIVPDGGNNTGRSFVYGNAYSTPTKTRKVTMSDCSLTFTNNNFVKCAQVFSACGYVKLVNSSFYLINNAASTSSAYTCRINLLYDEDINGEPGHYAEVSNCNISCTGKINGSYKAWASISKCSGAILSNCNIELGTCGTITEHTDIADGLFIVSVIGCHIKHFATTDIYIGTSIFSNNVIGSSGGIIYFSPGVIASGNIFANHARNDIQVYKNGSMIFIGNRVDRSCQLTTSESLINEHNYMGYME